jgi:8-amino-7-oxononanoate synthase
VDEAHSEGIFGPDGKGLVHHWDLQEKVDLVMGTFGKAYGCFGAHVCTSSLLRLWLENQSRSFIYATALPVQVVSPIRNALQISIEENWRREHLLKLSAQLRKDLKEDGWDILNSSTHIIPIVMGSNEKAIRATQFLERRGIRTAPVREPTVPKGTARLRVNVTAAHKIEHIQNLRLALRDFRDS